MRLDKLKIEYSTGDVPININTLLVQDLEDMEEIEYWEDRLRHLKKPYLVAYRRKHGRIKYSIFTKRSNSLR